MKFAPVIKDYFDKLMQISRLIIFFVLLILSFSTLPTKAIALNNTEGEQLFLEHCAGCHVNGGNIVRRNKSLRLKDLSRNSLDNPEAIAEIAREGIGIMSGYKEVLGENGDKLVAIWIWNQSQKAWVQG